MACPVCFSVANSGASLANGEIVHFNCLQKLSDELVDAERNAGTKRAEVAYLRSVLAKQETYLGKVVRFFGGGTDPDTILLRLRDATERLRKAENLCVSVKDQVTPIYDLLLEYPPDWKSRVNAVSARDRVCTNCGSARNLHVHHMVSLSNGGTNRIDNLKLLCKRCHQRAHGDKDFSGSNSGEGLAIAERVQVLKNAISSSSDVEFMYRKPTDRSYMKRTVKPYEIVRVDHEQGDGFTLCLRGYCYLRQADRIFALKRMKGLKQR